MLRWDLVRAYSLDIPGYTDKLHVDRAVAFIWPHLASSVNAAKRLRDSGAVKINKTQYKEVYYIPTTEDRTQGWFRLGVGKQGHEAPTSIT